MPAEPSRSWLLLSDRVVDLVQGEVRWPGGEQRLTRRELQLLSYLSRRAGQVVSRDALLVEVWGHSPDSLSRAVDLTVRRLRIRIEPTPQQPRHLLTVFGEGYRLVGVQHALPESNLSRPLDPAFGHMALLERLQSVMVSGCRALLLVGPFGVGKTRLASALGLRLRSRFRGGVWRSDLGACRSEAELRAALARTLRLEGVTLAVGLAARPATLLILDGFESLPEAADAMVAGWLQVAPALSVIVTSQRRVLVPGAQLVEVPSLSAADACALFVSRASACGRDLSTQPELCQRLVSQLDHLPLAIELAAVQTRHLSLPALLERLGPAVYQGRIEAFLASTFAALSPAAVALLGHCAVFSGGFTVEAVEVVAGQPVLPALRELQEHSLVLSSTARSSTARSSTSAHVVRLRLLGSVQQRAITCAQEAGTFAASCAAHARWAASMGQALAEQIDRTGRAAAWAQLEQERDNLMVAWRRAPPPLQRSLVRALGPILSELPTALQLIQQALQTAEQGEERGALQVLLGQHLRIRGKLPEAAQALDAALVQLPPDGLAARQARLQRALIAIDRGELEAALPQLEALSQTEPPDAIAGSAAVHRGRVLRGLGDRTAARRAALEGLDMLTAVGARRLQATAYGVLADLCSTAQSLVYLHEALAIHRAEGNLRGEGVALSNLVNALADQEQWAEMWTLAEQARAAHQALGARRSEGILLSNLCAIALSCWEMDRAEALGQQALRICRAHGLTGFEGQTLMNLGIGALAERRLEDALAQLHAARALFVQLDSPVMLAVTDGLLAATEAALGRLEPATTRLAAARAADVLHARPVLRACVGLQEGFIDLARAAAAPSPHAVAAHIATARGRIEALLIDGELPPELATTEVRGMIRLLGEAIAAAPSGAQGAHRPRSAEHGVRAAALADIPQEKT